MKQELCFAPFNDDSMSGQLVSYNSSRILFTYWAEPSILWAERFRLLCLQYTMPCPGLAQFIWTVYRSPVYRCRDSRASSSWSATTRYLANPELTTTHQNAKIQISALYPSFLQNQHDCQHLQSVSPSSSTLVLEFPRSRQIVWEWKQNDNLFYWLMCSESGVLRDTSFSEVYWWRGILILILQKYGQNILLWGNFGNFSQFCPDLAFSTFSKKLEKCFSEIES